MIVATNKNNILDRFFRTGTYKKDKVFTTISPSMDIQVASNFERLLYDLTNESGEKVSEFMNSFKEKGVIKVEKKHHQKTKESIVKWNKNVFQTSKHQRKHSKLKQTCIPRIKKTK